jgi:alpha-1,3-mannosyltransferase
LHRKKLVVSTHGGFFHTNFAARLKRIFFATVTRGSMIWYDGVVAISSADQAQFNRIRRRGILCIENGVNVRKFADAASRRPAKSMIWIGRFSNNKRLDRLIAFFAALKQRDPEWTLCIAGQSWDVDLNELGDMIRAASVEQGVSIVHLPDDTELRERMADCSVIVSASDYEGFGLVAIEGMSAGLLPLLSAIPPYERLVRESGTGLTVDFDRPEQAASSFLNWHRIIATDFDGVRAKSIAEAARYSWDHVAKLYQALYEDVLGRRSRTILDVPVYVGTQSQAVDVIDEAFASGKPTPIAYANAHTLNVAWDNEVFRDVLKRFLVMNDGIGVDAASRILFGMPFPDNLNGTDFTPYYLQKTKNNYRIFFLGSSSGVAERAAKRLIATCGRHQIAGCQNGYSRAGDATAIIAKIVASDADVVLVAMGNPKQEMWLAENLQASGCRLGFAVGALFDFLAEEVPRAPDWIRSARLEWCYRLLKEPARLWKRYVLGNPIFLMRVLGQWCSGARV